MIFAEVPQGIRVTFTEGRRSLGRALTFVDDHKIYEMMRRANAVLEDHNIVAYALKMYAAGRVELRLSEEQYARLLTSLRRA